MILSEDSTNRSRSDQISRFGLPPIPKLNDIELIYCVQLLFACLIPHMDQLAKTRATIMQFINTCITKFLQTRIRLDVIVFLFDQLILLLQEHPAALTAGEITKLMTSCQYISGVHEAVIHIRLVEKYWMFIHIICQQYLVG